MTTKIGVSLIILAFVANLCSADDVYIKVEGFGRRPSLRLLSVISGTNKCYLERHTPSIMRILRDLNADDTVTRIESDEEFNRLLKGCQELNSNYGANYLGLTFPGTKWCGPGDNADNYDDLGTEIETDKCCRGHDHCDDLMSAFSRKNNLTNWSIFTKLNCKCDDVFIECLKAANTETAKSVGVFFFNVVQNKCYKYDHPIVKCIDVPRKGSCNKYELDETKPKLWQWFENISFDVDE